MFKLLSCEGGGQKFVFNEYLIVRLLSTPDFDLFLIFIARRGVKNMFFSEMYLVVRLLSDQDLLLSFIT